MDAFFGEVVEKLGALLTKLRISAKKLFIRIISNILEMSIKLDKKSTTNGELVQAISDITDVLEHE